MEFRGRPSVTLNWGTGRNGSSGSAGQGASPIAAAQSASMTECNATSKPPRRGSGATDAVGPAPLRPGADVEGGAAETGAIQCEERVAGGDAGAAVDHHSIIMIPDMDPRSRGRSLHMAQPLNNNDTNNNKRHFFLTKNKLARICFFVHPRPFHFSDFS